MSGDAEKVPFRNKEGYVDITAHDALQNVMDEQYRAENEADMRNYRLIKTIKNLIDLAGFDLVGRIKVRERTTGRYYE